MDEGAPAGAFRLFEEIHVRLVGEAVAFAGVTGDAGADDIFPRGQSAALAGHDVIEIEFLPIKAAGTILAGMVVALVDVLAGEFDLFAGEALEEEEHDDSGDAYFEADGMDHVAVRFLL